MIVYVARNKVNGKAYVGQTRRSLSTRRKEHIRHARQEWRTKMLFHKALVKYGEDAFEWQEVACSDDVEALDCAEREWIVHLNSMDPSGYNLETGGSRNKFLSDKTKRLLSEKNMGHSVSEETRAAISNSKRGQVYAPRTVEHKLKLSQVKRGELNPHSKLTNEQVQIIKSLIGRQSQSSIAEKFGISQSTVSAISVGKLWKS